jgi:hypothetical protein
LYYAGFLLEERFLVAVVLLRLETDFGMEMEDLAVDLEEGVVDLAAVEGVLGAEEPAVHGKSKIAS